MPPSGRKGKPRARRVPATEAAQEPSDAETPEAIATPTRGSRKRARQLMEQPPSSQTQRNMRRKTKDTRGALDREDTEGTEAQDASDTESERGVPTEQHIIAHLKVADRHVNATEDFANDLLEGQENVPGYGKIAGRDWAFIIRKVEVNIGRPETQEKLEPAVPGARSTPTSKTQIDIDLGPDRQVSRSHAIIEYDPDSQQWLIVVNGRNGLRVDNTLMKRGSRGYLRNGSVIEIANTQMAFITTATEEGDGPVWDAAIIRQTQKSSEEEDFGEDDPRSNGHAGHGLSMPRLQGANYLSQYNGTQHQRMHPHSQRVSMNAIPGTPMKTAPWPKSSPAANYARGVMMESTESIDYSADSAKDLKPPHSYAQLIGMAILSTPEQQMTLNNIYKWIMANYAFYRFNTGGWQNSIRHNLSLNKAFTKIARRTDEPGKGMKWMIEPTEFDTFVSQGMKGCRRTQLPGTQSTFIDGPSSPTNMMRSQGSNAAGRRELDITPPMHSSYSKPYPLPNEAYTPDRGPRHGAQGLGISSEGHAQEYEFPVRSTPRRQNGLTAAANAAGSPPALYVNSDHDGGVGGHGVVDTPFPLRPTQRFAPPSTLKRPSDFIQFSSPAPFWKMEGLTGSTPFRIYDLSPLKTPFSDQLKSEAFEPKSADNSPTDGGEAPSTADDGTDEAADKTSDRKRSPVMPPSSSPPGPNSSDSRNELENSPTLARPATAEAKTLSQLAGGGSSKEQSGQQQVNGEPGTLTGNSSQIAGKAETLDDGAVVRPSVQMTDPSHNMLNGHPAQAHGGAYATGATGNVVGGAVGGAVAANGFVDEGEDEEIDLAKGFQPIGAFHQRNHFQMGMGLPPVSLTGQGFGR